MESLDQLRDKLSKFTGSFEKFHVALTQEQLVEIMEKMERHLKRAGKGGWGSHRSVLWIKGDLHDAQPTFSNNLTGCAPLVHPKNHS